MGRTYPILQLGLPPAPLPDEQFEVDELYAESHQQFIRYLAVVEGLDGRRMSAARLGWLSLWCQGLDLTFACLDARVGGASISTAALERLGTELMLKTRTLAAGTLKTGLKDGFVALAAWQLWSDRRTQQDELSYLHEVFDSSAVRQLESNPTFKKLHEVIHGELPRENDHVLSQQLQEARRMLQERGSGVEWWLEDGSIRRWLPTIEQLNGELKRPPSFAEVWMRRRGSSTRGQLREMSMSFVYAQYSAASQILHGSTLANYLSLGREAIEMGGLSSDSLANKLALANATLRNCWLLLGLTRSETWGIRAQV